MRSRAKYSPRPSTLGPNPPPPQSPWVRLCLEAAGHRDASEREAAAAREAAALRERDMREAEEGALALAQQIGALEGALERMGPKAAAASPAH